MYSACVSPYTTVMTALSMRPSAGMKGRTPCGARHVDVYITGVYLLYAHVHTFVLLGASLILPNVCFCFKSIDEDAEDDDEREMVSSFPSDVRLVDQLSDASDATNSECVVRN